MFFSCQPDGSNSKDWWRGWVGSCVIVLAFLSTYRVYSSVRGGLGRANHFAGVIYYQGKFCFVLDVAKLFTDSLSDGRHTVVLCFLCPNGLLRPCRLHTLESFLLHCRRCCYWGIKHNLGGDQYLKPV